MKTRIPWTFPLIAVLAIAMFGAAPAPKEFNVAVCGPTGGAEEHIVVSADEKTITWVADLAEDNSVEEDKDPVVCDISDKSQKDDITQYKASCHWSQAPHPVDYSVLVSKDHFVAMTRDPEGNITTAQFGKIGKESELPNGVLGDPYKADMAMCLNLVRTKQDELPSKLIEWLKHPVAPSVPGVGEAEN